MALTNTGASGAASTSFPSCAFLHRVFAQRREQEPGAIQHLTDLTKDEFPNRIACVHDHYGTPDDIEDDTSHVPVVLLFADLRSTYGAGDVGCSRSC